MEMLKKITLTLLLVAIALASAVKLAPASSDVENHQAAIEQLDTEISTVIKLTAGAAGASAVISLLPDDQCTPIANELAELSKYFLVVLSALYLEKYLISIMGYVSFAVVVPIICLLLAIRLFIPNQDTKKSLTSVSVKLGIFAVAVFLLIPVSTKISKVIYTNYDNSIEETLEKTDQISVEEDTEDSTAVEKFKAWIENAAVTVTQYVTGLLSDFVDALAVMLVTSCLIPILVILLFVWLMKILFGINIQIPSRKPLP